MYIYPRRRRRPSSHKSSPFSLGGGGGCCCKRKSSSSISTVCFSPELHLPWEGCVLYCRVLFDYYYPLLASCIIAVLPATHIYTHTHNKKEGNKIQRPTSPAKTCCRAAVVVMRVRNMFQDFLCACCVSK